MYKVCSIFSQVLKLFSRGISRRPSRSTGPSGTHGVSRAEARPACFKAACDATAPFPIRQQHPPPICPHRPKIPNPPSPKITITKEPDLFFRPLSLILKLLTGTLAPSAGQSRNLSLLHLNQEGNCVRQHAGGSSPRDTNLCRQNPVSSSFFSADVPSNDTDLCPAPADSTSASRTTDGGDRRQ